MIRSWYKIHYWLPNYECDFWSSIQLWLFEMLILLNILDIWFDFEWTMNIVMRKELAAYFHFMISRLEQDERKNASVMYVLWIYKAWYWMMYGHIIMKIYFELHNTSNWYIKYTKNQCSTTILFQCYIGFGGILNVEMLKTKRGR